ncbi:MAG TPA: serine/threonine-protein kinase, partial [Nannocystis exedens]|nr:serine/threonine-protein kinase [Nannocystis exedens]
MFGRYDKVGAELTDKGELGGTAGSGQSPGLEMGETLPHWTRGNLARPDLQEHGERLRRELLKAKLFGEPAQAVQIGRFRVLEWLGAGGMGVVYAAYDDRLDRKVAVKVLQPKIADRTSKARLQREAQAMARVSHPNIVSVHEVGDDGESLYIAMEFVRGESLATWIRDPHPWREVVEVFSQAGQGLAAAHAAGLVHRDFKPENAILGEDGRVKVLDFGLATASTASATVTVEDPSTRETDDNRCLTRTGALLGTPAYMSPEQIEGKEVTPASDQFSFFAALHEGLYGIRPFSGDNLALLFANVLEGKVVDPPPLIDIPAWLRKVLLRGLAREPEARFPSMEEALAALLADPRVRRRRWLLGSALVALAGGGILSAVLLTGRGEQCQSVGVPLTEVWNDARANEIHAAFVSTAGQIGVDTWALVEPRLDAWASEWIELRLDRCRSLAASELTDTLHDRSVACLDRQLTRVDALVTAFVVADLTTIERAVASLATLPPLKNCIDTEFLSSQQRLPDDPEAKTAVTKARKELEVARAQIDLGNYEEALASTQKISGVGEKYAYEPLYGLSEVIRGDALLWQEQAAAAEEALNHALISALESGDDHVAVEALARRIFVRAELLRDPERALADDSITRALLRRINTPPQLAWLVENNVAVAHERAGQSERARRGYERALEITSKLRKNSVEAVYTQCNLAYEALYSGDLAHARDLFVAARATSSRVFGEAHPSTITILEGEATAALLEGHLQQARAALLSARQIAELQSAANPAALLPIVELEVDIAALLRTGKAEELLAEANDLARRAYGEHDWRALFSRLGSPLYDPALRALEEAALASLQARPRAWGEAVESRLLARIESGAIDAARDLLLRAKELDLWKKLPEDRLRGLQVVEAKLLLELGRNADAKAILDGLKTDESGPLDLNIEEYRGDLAEAEQRWSDAIGHR